MRKVDDGSSASMLIAHIIYRLDVGGMENGLVNLINNLAADRYRHVVICLTEATEFRSRIDRRDVEIIECNKPPGKHLPTYWRIFRELRRLRPDVVHTRNLGTIDISWVAWLAGCPERVHGEHGWSPDDPQGLSKKYRLLRRLCDPAISRYVAVSHDIQVWLTRVIGVPESKTQVVHNGVDVDRFKGSRSSGSKVVFGTLGRQEPIKGLTVLLAAIRDLLDEKPAWRDRIKVVMAGDGPSHDACVALRNEFALQETVEFPGNLDDAPSFFESLDFFVQPSLNEGISNTVLEAMASGLAVIATEVGGNPELIRDGHEGRLVPANDAGALKDAIREYIADENIRTECGRAARDRAVRRFSLEAMVSNYEQFYGDSNHGTNLASA